MKPAMIFLLTMLCLTSIIPFSHAQETAASIQSLDKQQQRIVSISALTAVGDLEHLKTQLNEGLDAGLTVNEIKEILIQLYAYCGFPRSLNAIHTFMEVLNERKSNGMMDVEGKEATIVPSTDKYEQGRKVLEVLTKSSQPKPAPGFGVFAPRIDEFLKEHLFADVFASDVLTYQQRELITISALSSIQGLQAQLRSHISVGMNMGLTVGQLTAVADLIEIHVSRTQANILRNLLDIPGMPVIEPGMMVRIAELEIVPKYLEEYTSILKEASAASVKIEPGVMAIFPMYQQENPTQVRIVEIYRDSAAYQSHLKTPHFQQYKTSTLKMVKSLKLIDMDVPDAETMLRIFSKIK